MQGKATYYVIAVLIVCAWALIVLRVNAFFDADNTYAVQYVSVAPPNFDSPLHTVPPIGNIEDSKLLWLVNCENPLPYSFVPNNLVTHQGIRLHPLAYAAYSEMLAAMKADGIIGLRLASAYRPYEHQSYLFNGKVDAFIALGHSKEDAVELASAVLQRPGASEHQTGLALDVTLDGYLEQDFANTRAGQWIAANSHRFGFIIRYTQAKTDVTQIIYEPWHLRYVGTPHALIMKENNLALEEYAQFIADSGIYIVWSEPTESRIFYMVIHTYAWPEPPPQGLVGLSSDRPGGGVGYFLTIRRIYPALM